MLHEPAGTSTEKDHASDRKATYGVRLFVVYLLVYAGFVAINVLRPQWMGVEALLGLNVAVVYGFGLIIFAIVLGVIYSSGCSRLEREMNKADADGEGQK